MIVIDESGNLSCLLKSERKSDKHDPLLIVENQMIEEGFTPVDIETIKKL